MIKSCMSCPQTQQAGTLSSYFPQKNLEKKSSKCNMRESSDGVVVQPFHFPPTKQVWWDRKAQGSPEVLHLTSKRNLTIHLNEKTLRLAVKHLNKSPLSSYDCFFIGSLFVDSREDAVEINIDRFDPGREFADNQAGSKTKIPTTVVPGDQVIPLKLVKGLMGAEQIATHSKQDFQKTFGLLQSRFTDQEPLSLSNFISTKSCCHVHTDTDELILNVQVGVVTMATSILATPVSPVPIIPTALARNLTGPLRLSDVQGVPKCGFLTMDHTRKLLLLLESDPKAYSLPLVGVWVSGPFTVHHPFIWACCIRFLHSKSIKERSLVSANTFLLVHYSPAQTKPIFWECTQQDQMQGSQFDLLSCYENLHLDQMPTSQYPEPICLELLPSRDNLNQVLFNQAFTLWNKKRAKEERDSNDEHQPMTMDNGPVEPCPSPSPYPQPHQGKLLLPIVPEASLSLSFEESRSLEEKTTTPTEIPAKGLRRVHPERLIDKEDQENTPPGNIGHGQHVKQVLSTKMPQRLPLQTITGRKVNTPCSGPEDRQSLGPKQTLKNKQIKAENLSRNGTHNNDNLGVNVRKDELQREKEQSNLLKVEENIEKVQFGRDETKENFENKEREHLSFQEDGDYGDKNPVESMKISDNCELCDSGVGDYSKDDSFPEEVNSKESQPDPYELIMKQELQIKELQQQINLLVLQQSLSHFSHNGIPTPPPTPVTADSSCVESPHLNPTRTTTSTNTEKDNQIATATNTGSSLLLISPIKTRKVSTSTSPMIERIEDRASHLVSERPIENPQSSSLKYVTTDKKKASDSAIELDQTIREDELVIQGTLDNTNMTLASSIHAVDICEFSPEPSSRHSSGLQESSPVLGESASMLLLGKVTAKSEKHQYDSLLLRNEKQFYDNLLIKVKELLSECPDEEKIDDCSRNDKKSGNLPTVHVPTRDEVMQATVKELARLKDTSEEDASLRTFEQPLSNSIAVNDVISGLPRLNYLSMSIEERITNSILQLDPLDADYLSQSQIDEYKHSIKDYCQSYGQRGGNSNSTNCTWNDLSSATRDYLHRYNLNERVSVPRQDDKSVLGRSKASNQCCAPPSTPEPLYRTDRILDIERLRKLPKLL